MKPRLFDASMIGTLQEAADFITNILQSSTEYSIIGKDLEGEILLWNEGARRIYGYEAEEVTGKVNASILYSAEEEAAGKPGQVLKAALRDGKWDGTLRRRRKSGEEFTAQVVITPRFDSRRRAIGFLLISKDISRDIRLNEALETANQELLNQVSDRRLIEADLRLANGELCIRALQLQARTREIQLLMEMSALLHSCANQSEAREITTQFAQQLFPSSSGALYLAPELGRGLEAFIVWASEADRVKKDLKSEDCWALRLGRVHVVEGLSCGPACSHVSAEGVRGYICAPMLIQGQVVGLLHTSWREKTQEPEQQTDSKRRLVTMFADSVALALANLRLREQLRDETTRDPLTQLFNRRYFEESLTREISRARRSGSPIGIIMIDIDHFKRINDSFGHGDGDEILRVLGRYFQANVRPEDIPTRYGGEEFLLVLPGASLSVAQQRAESLRAGVQFIPEISKNYPGVTLSLGVAVFPDHGENGFEVVRSADEALYVAKRSGRDRVVVASTATIASPVL